MTAGANGRAEVAAAAVAVVLAIGNDDIHALCKGVAAPRQHLRELVAAAFRGGAGAVVGCRA